MHKSTLIPMVLAAALSGATGRVEAQAQASPAPAGELGERLDRVEALLRRLEMAEAQRSLPPMWRTGSYPWMPWYPWFPAPPSQDWRDDYGPSIEHTPRVGLQNVYRGAEHMGIRPPSDTNPLYVLPNLGRFEGIVGKAKSQLLAEAEAAADAAPGRGAATAAPSPGRADPDDEVVKLLKAAKYKEAGRIAAARFQETQSVADALLLVEAFVGLGKYSTAQALLTAALEAENAAQALPEEIASHFSSPEELQKHVQELESRNEYPLLCAYVQVHSRQPERGLEALQNGAIKEQPAAKVLWRRYLGKAFQ